MLNLKPVYTEKIVNFNVGGKLFSTLVSTISKSFRSYLKENEYYDTNLLEDLFSDQSSMKDLQHNAIFIDRNPKFFNYILDYLRKSHSKNERFELPTDDELRVNLLNEATFFKVFSLADQLKYPTYLFSNILTPHQEAVLQELCDLNHNFNLKLIYRASEDGFSATDFHRRCDGYPNTLTIVKVKGNNNIFGGFSSLSWGTENNYKEDNDAYIFSLVNKYNRPIRFPYVSAKLNEKSEEVYSIYSNSLYGPSFGGGPDLSIASNSNMNQNSYSFLGHSYKNPNYLLDAQDSKTFLARSFYFTVEEVEVFHKQD
jgi:hypothetical protein